MHQTINQQTQRLNKTFSNNIFTNLKIFNTMKKIMFLATIVAMMIAVMPAQAQSRKDKKAAQRANWEMEQQQKREEAELRHQMKMDSLRGVQKAKEDAEAKAKIQEEKAEQARLAAEEEERARQKKAEEMAAAQEVDITDEPCTEIGSSESFIRARGIGESLQQQMARTKAQTNAVRELGAKIGTTVQALIKHYANEETISIMTDEAAADGMQFEEKLQQMTKQKVDQNLSFNTFCEKTRTYMKNNKKVFKCYMTIQTGKDDMLKPVYDEIQKEAKGKLNIDYQNFSEEFDKEFNKE